MSKRFGRNQKRAMREALIEQTDATEAMRKQRDNVIANQRPMREALDRVARVLGPHFFGLPAAKRVVDRLTESYRMPVHQVVSLISNSEMEALTQCAITQLDTVSCSALLDELRQLMHVRLHTPRGDIAYAISSTALACATVEDLTYEVAPMLARGLVESARGSRP